MNGQRWRGCSPQVLWHLPTWSYIVISLLGLWLSSYKNVSSKKARVLSCSKLCSQHRAGAPLGSVCEWVSVSRKHRGLWVSNPLQRWGSKKTSGTIEALARRMVYQNLYLLQHPLFHDFHTTQWCQNYFISKETNLGGGESAWSRSLSWQGKDLSPDLLSQKPVPSPHRPGKPFKRVLSPKDRSSSPPSTSNVIIITITIISSPLWQLYSSDLNLPFFLKQV